MSEEEIAPDFESGPLDELTRVLPATVVRELSASFYESVASCFAKLDAAAIDNDWTAIKEQAHDLKGISGTFGAKRLQQLSDELEHMHYDQESARVAHFHVNVVIVGARAHLDLFDRDHGLLFLGFFFFLFVFVLPLAVIHDFASGGSRGGRDLN